MIEEVINNKFGDFDKIELLFSGFLTNLKGELKQTERQINQLNENYKELANYFGEEGKDMGSDSFFELFYRIFNTCKKAKTIIIKEMKNKEMENKRKEKENNLNSKNKINKKIIIKIKLFSK